MKPNLKLEHLAPYLAYKLKIYDTISKKSKIMNLGQGSSTSWVGIKTALSYGAMPASIYKPMLHPISDLDILIRNEFEKFDSRKECDMEIITLFSEENGIGELIENIDLKSIPYECAEYMFKNHYDFFGLIEQDLAIDYNTLN